MADSANETFVGYGLDHPRLPKDVLDRFTVVLKVVEQQQQQQQRQQEEQQQPFEKDEMLDRTIRSDRAPVELRPMIRYYADITARKSSKHYNAYLIVNNINQIVENINGDQDLLAIKARQVEKVYSMLAR